MKEDKKAFLYPREWLEFAKLLSEKQKPYFKIVVNSGGRINEILHVTPNDLHEREGTYTLTFRITKVRAKKKETRPEPRTILISADCYAWLQRYIKRNNIKPNESIVSLTPQAIYKIIKTKLKQLETEGKVRIGVANDISSHNIRKTHGNWLKALGVDIGEIAGRLGHDINTMLKHYVSPTLFNVEDRILMVNELGQDLIRNMGGHN